MTGDSSEFDSDIELPEDTAIRGNKNNKKGRPLGPANEKQQRGRKRRSHHVSDSDGSGDEFLAPAPRNRQIVAVTPALMSDNDSRLGENQPPSRGGRPQSKAGDVESSDDEEEQNGWAGDKKKTRKRLSLRLSRGGSAAPSNVSSVAAPRHDADTLKTIYATCMDLFQTHKITQENAFQLRFLDLMGEILDMPDFNKNDMLNAGRMLETGAKIYVCRVDKTKHSVLDLASTLSMQSKKNKAAQRDDQNENDPGVLDDGAGEDFQAEEIQKKAKNRGKKRMKEQRFIVDNEAKISLTLEDDTATPAMRREALKAKFNGVGDEDKDFDYHSFFYESPAENPLVKDGAEVFDSLAPLSEAMLFRAEAQTIGYMPFIHRQDFQSSLVDIWGQPLIPGTEMSPNNDPQIPNEAEFQNGNDDAHEDNRSYVGDGGGLDDLGHDDLEEGNNGNVTFVDEDGIQRNEEGMIVVNPQRFNNLKDFYNMYSAIKAKLGWCGPAFVKPTNFLNTNGLQRKPRVKKEPVFPDLRGADWSRAHCKYDTSQVQKTVFDERTIERWSGIGRITSPFLGYEADDDEVDFKYLNALLEQHEDEENEVSSVPHIFRYFLDHNRNVIQTLKGLIRDEDDDVMEQFVRDEEDYIEDAGFDIERHRDLEDLEGDMGMDNGVHREDQIIDPLEVSTFPASLGLLCMQSDFDPVSGTGDGDSVKFTKKPKPIDMHSLKRSITRFLHQRLQLGDGGVAVSEEDTSVDLRSLIVDVCQNGDRRMVEHLTIPIIIVGLMHVVVDKKLFITPDPSNPRIIKRGKLWDHARHIPQPADTVGYDAGD